jgi:hypothetical protein
MRGALELAADGSACLVQIGSRGGGQVVGLGEWLRGDRVRELEQRREESREQQRHVLRLRGGEVSGEREGKGLARTHLSDAEGQRTGREGRQAEQVQLSRLSAVGEGRGGQQGGPNENRQD